MKKFSAIIIFALIFSVILSGCIPRTIDNSEESRDKDAKIAELEQKIKELESNQSPTSNNLLSRVIDVIGLIKDKDMNTLSQYVHPTKGVRFTPYFYIDTQTDQVFTAQQITGLMQDNQIIHWGNYDGTGDPIELKFSDYYDKFVYDKDFANPQIIGNNVPIGRGNTIDNITQAYPDGHFIEFHFSQFDPQYEGMDWESLRLVFEEDNGIWYLVGVIHGQWTI